MKWSMMLFMRSWVGKNRAGMVSQVSKNLAPAASSCLQLSRIGPQCLPSLSPAAPLALDSRQQRLLPPTTPRRFIKARPLGGLLYLPSNHGTRFTFHSSSPVIRERCPNLDTWQRVAHAAATLHMMTCPPLARRQAVQTDRS